MNFFLASQFVVCFVDVLMLKLTVKSYIFSAGEYMFNSGLGTVNRKLYVADIQWSDISQPWYKKHKTKIYLV